MPSWKQITSNPAGALPSNLLTRIIVIAAGLLVAILILSVSVSGTPEGADGPTPIEESTQRGTIDPGVQQRINLRVEEQQDQANSGRDDSVDDARRAAIREANLRLLEPADPFADPFADPLASRSADRDEAELRLALRLEDIERQTRSLRAPPVALSRRPQASSASAGAVQPAAGPAGRLQASLDSLYSTAAAAAAAQQTAATNLQPPSAQPPGGTLDVPLPDSRNLPAYDAPGRLTAPEDPRGSHRIYEGSLVEAILLTQLSGDFPAPVIAQVSAPFYSRDRQVVLIPRGSRFIGSAQAVRHRDQSRLAVGFHRLILPDGRWAAMRFQGLSQIGEGALRDQVQRHYLSTFLAAGGVGILSGLAHAGSNPYGGTQQTLQIGAAQSIAQTGAQIMDRFLNRLPTVTIRAGHRVRVWFTADLLITPEPRSTTP